MPKYILDISRKSQAFKDIAVMVKDDLETLESNSSLLYNPINGLIYTTDLIHFFNTHNDTLIDELNDSGMFESWESLPDRASITRIYAEMVIDTLVTMLEGNISNNTDLNNPDFIVELVE